MSVRRIRNGSARPPSAGLAVPGLVVPGQGLSRRKVLGRAAGAGLLAMPAASLLASCATGGGEEDDGGNDDDRNNENPFGFVANDQVDAVFFTGGFGTEYPQALKAAFETRWPEAQVGVTTTETIATEMQPRFAGGNPPDFMNNSGDDALPLSGLVNDGAIHPLTELLDAPSIDDPNVTVRDSLDPSVMNEGVFGGTLYALNYVRSTYGMWYNAKLFRDNGWTPPTTWTEFLTLADQMKAADVAPFVNGNVTAHFYLFNMLMEWINLEGGHEAVIAIDNLEPDAWHQPAVVTAAQRMRELVDSDLIYPGMDGLNHIQAQQAWLDGEAGFLWCGTWLEGEMSDPAALEENGVTDGGIPADFEMTMAAPWAPSDNPIIAPGSVRTAAGEMFTIPTDGPNRAGGLELMRVMCSKAYANEFSALTNNTTVVKGSGETVESEPLKTALAVSSASPENLFWRWDTWYNTKMYQETMQLQIIELLAGRISPEELLDSMQAAADEVKDDPETEKFTREA